MKIIATMGLLVALLTSGCTRFNFPYRIDVEQGNVVTQDAVDQLRPGMDRRQVAFILGTPLITADFRPERWDYFYSMQKGTGRYTKRYLTLFFHGDTLVRLEGDMRPGGGDDEVAEVRREVLDKQSRKPIKEAPTTRQEEYIEERRTETGGGHL